MKRINKGYLLFIPIMVLMVFSYFIISYTAAHGKFREKFIEKQLEIDLISRITEKSIIKDDDWIEEHHFYVDDMLKQYIEEMDIVPGVFAGLYDKKLNLISSDNAITATFSEKFNPLKFSEFIEAVNLNDRGMIILPFSPPGQKAVEIKIYYRWCPLIEGITDPYLLVVGISIKSVSAPLPFELVFSFMLTIIIIVALSLSAAIIIIKEFINGR